MTLRHIRKTALIAWVLACLIKSLMIFFKASMTKVVQIAHLLSQRSVTEETSKREVLRCAAFHSFPFQPHSQEAPQVIYLAIIYFLGVGGKEIKAFPKWEPTRDQELRPAC